MNSIDTTISQTFNPIDLLEKSSTSQVDVCLQVSKEPISYFFYFSHGKLSYATHSVDPFERLDRHLRRLSHQIPTITKEVRNLARLHFENKLSYSSVIKSDYLAICWLLEEKYIKQEQASILIHNLTLEVLETYLFLDEPAEVFTSFTEKMPVFCGLDLKDLSHKGQKSISQWQILAPSISSSYQRLYFASDSPYAKKKLPEEQSQKLSSILKGFNFRQLAVLLNQDELSLARKFYPLIVNGAILLRDPQTPFDQLPKISNPNLGVVESNKAATELQQENTQEDTGLPNFSNLSQKNYKIACVDDSPTILDEINRFLENDSFSVFLINNSAKALMQIVRIHPDLILLDVGMPNIDGYKLCSMLRKHSLFKETPIVMVTGNKGIIDRAKARLAGATDYMTKPFTQPELLKMVFRHLT